MIVSVESALTTLTPTPWRPPEVLYALPSNLPPEWRVVMMTSSADLPGYFGCGSTGMPRPLSKTVRRLPGSSVTSMRLAWPATASSIALSMTSAARWWSARASVPPMYMPGRRRTGSRPSRTSIEEAS